MRKLMFVGLLIVIAACLSRVSIPVPGLGLVLEAQALPYAATVAWNASADATTYSVYLDGVLVTSGITTLTTPLNIPTLGLHTIGVTAVNPTFVPPESTPGTLSFTLKQPSPVSGVKVK